MKALVIKSDNCLLSKNSYGVTINDKDISKLVLENLPEGLKDYKDYPVKVSLQIEFPVEDGLSIVTEGYEVNKEENKESEVEE